MTVNQKINNSSQVFARLVLQGRVVELVIKNVSKNISSIEVHNVNFLRSQDITKVYCSDLKQGLDIFAEKCAEAIHLERSSIA